MILEDCADIVDRVNAMQTNDASSFEIIGRRIQQFGNWKLIEMVSENSPPVVGGVRRLCEAGWFFLRGH